MPFYEPGTHGVACWSHSICCLSVASSVIEVGSEKNVSNIEAKGIALFM